VVGLEGVVLRLLLPVICLRQNSIPQAARGQLQTVSCLLLSLSVCMVVHEGTREDTREHRHQGDGVPVDVLLSHMCSVRGRSRGRNGPSRGDQEVHRSGQKGRMHIQIITGVSLLSYITCHITAKRQQPQPLCGK